MPSLELNVWLDERHAATLLRTRSGELRLRYTEEMLELYGENAIVMSVALPVSRQRYKGPPVEYWTESLLPEGETRTTIENRFGVRRGDTFGLLDAIGADCAGAVSFLPAGATPGQHLEGARTLTARDLDTAIEQLPTHPLGVDDDVRVSLGGLQSKLLLVRTGEDGWARPVGGSPSTHIIKPDPIAYPGLVVAEAFTLAMARAAGIAAAEYELVTLGGRPALVLERFDRVVQGRHIARLHQEDACAALGVNPTGRYKYQSQDPASPSLIGIADLLSRHGTDRRADLTALAEAVTLRIAVGDTDGHARNYGLLHTGHTIVLAPLYDAAPTSAFVTTREVGLWVGEQPYLSAITVDHLTRELRSWGVPARLAAHVPLQTLERLQAALADAQAAVPQVEESIVDGVGKRIKRLLQTAGD